MSFLKKITKNYYTKIYFPKYNSGWVLGHEYLALQKITEKINLSRTNLPFKQYCFIPDKYYAINKSKYHLLKNRVVFDYFHGNPKISSDFYNLFQKLKYKKRNFFKIRVSNSLIYKLFLEEGFDRNFIKLIPIGIDIELFPLRNTNSINIMRKKYDIPSSAFVIGSFQKDGNGWNEGITPKLIKGPDIFLNTINILKKDVSNIFVLLTGPSRGYVKKGLSDLSVPYKHIYIKDYDEIYQLYHTLDYYIISSREEGGPKALLECMATGVPVISTNVGQSVDILINNFNGFKTHSLNPEEIANLLLDNIYPEKKLIISARNTAEQHDYNKQLESWKSLFSDLY